MYLERLLGTNTKIAVLAVLASQKTRLTESELAKKAGVAVSEVNRQAVHLVQSGLVSMERVGRSKMYSLNRKHFLVPSLNRLFSDLEGVYLEAAKKIAVFASSLKGVEAVILVGSVARAEPRQDLVEKPSDMDLIFIVKRKNHKDAAFERLVAYINGEILSKYGFISYPIVVSKDEYMDGLKKNGRLFIDAQAAGVELYGRKPKRFG